MFTVLVLIKLTKFAVDIAVALIKNVVHSLVPGVSPGAKLCATFLNIKKYFKTLRCGCVIFSI